MSQIRLISAIFALTISSHDEVPFPTQTNFNTFIIELSFNHSRHINQHEDIIKKP